MSFSIQTTTENELSIIRLTNNSSQTVVELLPAYGAMLHSFVIITNNGPINIIDNYADKNTVEAELTTSFKSAKLSPFVCRINNGRYSWKDKQYEFSEKFMDGSAIHGLLCNKPFTLTDQYCNDTGATVQLKYEYKRLDSGYPFNYTCEVRYTLYPDNSLQVETSIQNLEEHAIPIADGWHPYFTLGGKINGYEMRFASDTILEFSDTLIPTGKVLHNSSFKEFNKIGNLLLDNCFQLQIEEGRPVCELHNPANGVTLLFYTNTNYPFLQIYTPDHRNSIAIENLSAAPDCFNNGMGLKTLLPKQSETFNVRYQLQLH